MKTAVLVLSLATVFGLGGMHLAQEMIAPNAQRYVVQLDENASAIEKARSAVFQIWSTTYKGGGSAILVGRKKLDNGYRYTALTAYHVIDDMAKAFAKGKSLADHSMDLMFQPTFHGNAVRLKIDIDDIEWAITAHDWAAFTFDAGYKLNCVEIATEAEFKSLTFLDEIYAIGYSNRSGQFVRRGNIGTTHNEHRMLQAQITKGQTAPNIHPEKFFRPYINIWYGDSGGGIFSRDGKLIGIINSFSIARIAHLAVALKAHVVLDDMQHNKDFLLIED